MGVHGLWKLLESAGKPVPVETLENKVLAVDVSIWLHQAARGFQDARGQSLPNAHLLGLFHRLCKLLFWRVRPVFVFDGATPLLKQQTVAARRRRREGHQERADRARLRLLQLHLKRHAVREALARRRPASAEGDPADPLQPQPLPPLRLPGARPGLDDLFTLPPCPPRSPTDRSEDEDDPEGSVFGGRRSSSEDEDEDDGGAAGRGGSGVTASGKRWRFAGRHLDMHSVDVRSADFLALPADVRHDILSELKETRKQSSWGRLHEMPRESTDFSSYQMERLLKRRSVQESLEAAEKEMGGRSLSLAEMEKFMTEAGALDVAGAAAAGVIGPGRRIAGDEHTRYIYITGAPAPTSAPAPASASASAPDDSKTDSPSEVMVKSETTLAVPANVDIEPKPSTSQIPSFSFEETIDNYSDDVSEWIPEISFDEVCKQSSEEQSDKGFQLAQNFIFENSGLTQDQILAVIKDHASSNKANLVKRSLDEPSTSKAGISDSIEEAEIGEESDDKKDVVNHTLVRSGMSKEKIIDIESSSVLNHTKNSFYSKNEKVCKNDVNEESLNNENVQESTFNCNKAFKGESEDKIDYFKTGSTFCAFDEKYTTVKPKNETEISHITNNKSTSMCLQQSSLLNDKQEISSIIQDASSTIDLSASCQQGFDGEDSSVSEDFVEVNDSNSLEEVPTDSLKDVPKVPTLEVVIKPTVSELADDIFADVFGSNNLDVLNKQTVDSKIVNQSPSETHNTSKVQKSSENTYDVTNNYDEHIGTVSVVDNTEIKVLSSGTSPIANNESVGIISDDSSGAEQITTEMEINDVEIVKPKTPPKLSNEQLEELEGSLQEEGNRLVKLQAKDERLGATITEQMVSEAQELLQLFGVPFLVAPMEAEAQCAFLDHASLTDGTITDDSDIWLFGGQKVYKNFFDQKKHVLQFRDIDIQHSFKLSRSQLVLLALLVGSDYTTGLTGVGPVTALEILAAFPPHSKNGPPEQLVEGLRHFREWFTSDQRVDKMKLRNKLKNLELNKEFPSMSVVEAYLSPKVDESLEKFSWSTPDVESIKEFARIKFGWPASKTVEILQPIMKKLNIKISQLSIDSYFKPKPHLPPADNALSKRVKVAIDQISASQETNYEDEPSSSKKIKMEHAVQEKGKIRTCEEKNKITNLHKKKQTKAKSKPKGNFRGESLPSTDLKNTQSSNMQSELETMTTLNSKRRTLPPLNAEGGKEFILQREKDKIASLRNKLRAIEVFRKSARGLDKTKRDKKEKRKVLKEAYLSESGSSSD